MRDKRRRDRFLLSVPFAVFVVVSVVSSVVTVVLVSLSVFVLLSALVLVVVSSGVFVNIEENFATSIVVYLFFLSPTSPADIFITSNFLVLLLFRTAFDIVIVPEACAGMSSVKTT